MATKTCVKCKKTFEPHQNYFQHCNRCFMDFSNPCEVCENPCMKKRCHSCVDRVMEKCKVCKKMVYLSPFKGCCHGCNLIYSQLPWEKWTGVDEKGKVKVIYSVTDEEHDGYCSDPGDVTVKETEVTEIYPLCSGGLKNEFYERNPEGDGYCGMERTYKIKSLMAN